jgi:2-dehydropantoate 2-reductase
MRILIVGAGAIGGYFGARLIAAHRDVTFLVRPRTAALLAANGLQLSSPTGDVSIPTPATVLAPDLHAFFDLILLSCKAQDLASAMDDFAPAVGPQTAILPLLNGMAHMPALDQRFGREHVLGGSTTISVVRDPDGRIRHLAPLDTLYFGDRDTCESPRIQGIAAALTGAGFDAHSRPHIEQDMWNKWVIISTAAITCLMRATIGDLVAAGGSPLVAKLNAESAAIATAEGFPPPAPFLESLITRFTQSGSLFTTSMLRDLESGAPIEAHQIIGDLIDHARPHAIPTPLLTVLYAHLRSYEERRLRESKA